jgi:Fe-S-cluster containining protein
MASHKEKRQTKEWPCEHCGWCCEVFPLDPKFVEAHREQFQRPVIKEILTRNPFSGKEVIVVNTGTDPSSDSCVFLKRDNTCAVYNDRPDVCRKFGLSGGAMECLNIAPDGRVRSKEERIRAKKRIVHAAIERERGLYEKQGFTSKNWWDNDMPDY